MEYFLQSFIENAVYWIDRGITGECSRIGVIDFVYIGGHKIYTN